MFDSILVRAEDDSQAVKYVVVLSILLTALAIVIAQYIFPFKVGGRNYGGFIAVMISALALSYPLMHYIRSRDRKEFQRRWRESTLLARHISEINVFLSCFTASVVVFSVSTFLLPEGFFAIQNSAIESVRGFTGSLVSPGFFLQILKNNLGLFFATFILTFFVAGGMVFVVLWNASVLGVLVGRLAGSLFEIPVRLFPFVAHGLLEVAGYVSAGLSGYLLAYGFEEFIYGEGGEVFKTPVRDALILLGVGLCIIVVAAFVEQLG